jgi:hypothetical protein
VSTSFAYATSLRRDESNCAPSGNANCATCALACPKAGGRKEAPRSSHDTLNRGEFADFLVGGSGNDLLFGQPA